MSRDGATVLVVDDDPACRDLHSIWLDDEYDVLTAADGETALDHVGAADVMLLDRQMPRLDGEAVARHVRSGDHECFVVMISGVEPDFDMLDLPVDEYLTKPVSRGDVCEVVQTMVSRARCQRLLREYSSLSARKAALELRKSPATLAASPEYDQLVTQLEQKREHLDEMLAAFEDDWRQAILAAVAEDQATTRRSTIP